MGRLQKMERTGAAAFFPMVVTMNTADGQLLWSSGACELPKQTASVVYPTSPQMPPERVIAVQDCNGKGGADFSFDVTIKVADDSGP